MPFLTLQEGKKGKEVEEKREKRGGERRGREIAHSHSMVAGGLEETS